MFLPDDSIRVLLVPGVALALPIGLTLWARRSALRDSTQDRAAVWFGFARFLRWVNVATLTLWWAAGDFAGLAPWLRALFESEGVRQIPGTAFFELFLLWLPAALVCVLCSVLAQPVYASVRGIAWSRGDLAKQAALMLCVTVVPIVLTVAAFRFLFEGNDLKSFLLTYCGALCAAIASARALRKFMRMVPHALTTGELRDRAFALADKLGVKLQQVYVMPAGKARMANAFARSGRSILLTDYLLRKLERAEVDGILAHELAHLKHGHPKKLGFALIGGCALMLGVSYLPWPHSLEPVQDILWVVVPLLALYFFSRRFEFEADATAARLTDDPAAAITGLVKVHRLNLMPIHWGKWDERLLTHPSTLRRAEAIAKQAQWPRERVTQLLEAATRPATDGPEGAKYALPATVAGEGKIFSSEFKQGVQLRASLLNLAFACAGPALILRLALALGLEATFWPMAVLTLALCIALWLMLANFVPFLGCRRLSERFRARFQREGSEFGGGGVFVGFSPGDAPRLFENNYSWDAGHLFLEGDRLCYWGEETRFALPSEQLTVVRLGRGVIGWLPAKSVFVSWKDPAAGKEGTFSVRPLGVRSLLEMNAEARRLADAIQGFARGNQRREVNSALSVSLPAPQFGAVTGSSITEFKRRQRPLLILLVAAFLSGCASAFLGMPIDFPALGDGGAFGNAGNYALLTSCLLVLFAQVPFWRYREPRAVQPARPDASQAVHTT